MQTDTTQREFGPECMDDWREKIRPAVSSATDDRVKFQIERAIVCDEEFDSVGDDYKGDEFQYYVKDAMLNADERKARTNHCNVLLFGCGVQGEQILVRVPDFMPYIYYEYPSEDITGFKTKLSRYVRVCVDDMHFCVQNRTKMYGWEPNANASGRRVTKYLKVSFPTLRSFYQASKALPSVFGIPHEANILPETKFLDDINATPSSWLVSSVASAVIGPMRISHDTPCSAEYTCSKNGLTSVDEPDIAPMLVAFFDIECVSASSGFPDANQPGDAVHQIGIVFWRLGHDAKSATRLLLVQPDTCGPVGGCHVLRYRNEAELLRGFREVIVESDPSFIASYNGFKFDIPYLHDRAKRLGVCDFMYLDRIQTHMVPHRVTSIGPSTDVYILDMYGRSNIDLYHWVRGSEKLMSYSLNAVCEAFLDETKHDMNIKELFRMVSGSPTEIATVGQYCIQDCFLLVKLSIRLQVFTSNVEMSRVTHTPMEMIVTRGQQVRVVNQLVWHGHRIRDDASGCTYIMNTPSRWSGSKDDKYMGAWVIDACVNFYTDPIVTLDFKSLYPSIMLANNFCFSTLVQSEEFEGIEGVEYSVIDFAFEEGRRRYVWAKNAKGVIPTMLRHLLDARDDAKASMNACIQKIDSCTRRLEDGVQEEAERGAIRCELNRARIERAVYNGRQMALKVSANAIYGFTGAMRTGKYPCIAIADCVTYRAREMLHRTCDIVRNYVPCKIVYGDTDSVMIRFDGETTVEGAAKVGSIAADHITGVFAEETRTDGIIIMEFEKVYHPYLLMSKKRYAGMMYEMRDGVMKQTKVDAKGIELVRRDNCPMAKRCQKLVLDALLYHMDHEKAMRDLTCEVERVVRNELPYEDYVITMGIGHTAEGNGRLAHVKVQRDIAEREPGSEPKRGDRVAYVLTFERSNPNAKAFEKAQDVTYAKENGKVVDRLYYIEHQVERSVCALLENCTANPHELFERVKGAIRREQNGQRSIMDMMKSAVEVEAPRESVSNLPSASRPSKKSKIEKKGGSKMSNKDIRHFIGQ